METVYIETSIVSYLVAEPSRDLVTAANQQMAGIQTSFFLKGVTMTGAALLITQLGVHRPQPSSAEVRK